MWRISLIPDNYTSPLGEEWCIIDEDGDIFGFYFSKEDANNALEWIT